MVFCFRSQIGKIEIRDTFSIIEVEEAEAERLRAVQRQDPRINLIS